MSRKLQSILVGMMILAILACQSTTPPATNPTEPTPVPVTPTPLFPAWGDVLDGPDTACFLHNSEEINHPPWALTCLESEGWHLLTDFSPFKDPSQVVHCTGERTYLVMERDRVIMLANQKLTDLTAHKDDKTQIFDIACGQGETVWTTTYNGVEHFDGTDWKKYSVTDILGSESNNEIDFRDGFDLAVTPDSKVWVLVSPEGDDLISESLAVFDGDNWQVVKAGLHFDLIEDMNGNLWVKDNEIDQVLKYDEGEWSSIPLPQPMDCVIQFLRINAEGRPWALCHENAIFAFDPQTDGWTQQFTGDTLNGVDVNDMQFDRMGRLWTATNYGIYVHDGTAWKSYHMYSADLYDEFIDAIVIRGEGPPLPSLASKMPGTVHGKLSGPNPIHRPYPQVEICLERVDFGFYGETPCSHQAYHELTTVSNSSKIKGGQNKL